jgi:hypothetical protein
VEKEETVMAGMEDIQQSGRGQGKGTTIDAYSFS